MTEARASLAAANRIFEQIGDRVGAAGTASLLVSLTAKLALKAEFGRRAPAMHGPGVRADAERS